MRDRRLRSAAMGIVVLALAACADGDHRKRMTGRVMASDEIVRNRQLSVASHRHVAGAWPAATGRDDYASRHPLDPFTVRVAVDGVIHVDFGGDPADSELAGTGYTLWPTADDAAESVHWRCEVRGMPADYLPERCR